MTGICFFHIDNNTVYYCPSNKDTGANRYQEIVSILSAGCGIALSSLRASPFLIGKLLLKGRKSGKIIH
jgi:hypothetical protein